MGANDTKERTNQTRDTVIFTSSLCVGSFLSCLLAWLPYLFYSYVPGGSIPPDHNWEDSTHYYRYTLISYPANVLFIGAPFCLGECARLFIRYQKT